MTMNTLHPSRWLCLLIALTGLATAPLRAQTSGTDPSTPGTAATAEPEPMLSRIEAPRPKSAGGGTTVEFDVQFEVDKQKISPLELEKLNALLDKFRNAGTVESIVVTGYVNEPGTTEYRIAVAAKRADRIATYIVMRGYPHERLRVIGSPEQTWQMPQECKGKKGAALKAAPCANPGSPVTVTIVVRR